MFVSHKMATVIQFCKNSIGLQNGTVVFAVNTNDEIDYYLRSNQYEGYVGHYSNESVGESGFLIIALVDNINEIRTEFSFD